MTLVTPAIEHLPSYVEALKRGWSANHQPSGPWIEEQLAKIAAEPARYVESHTDPEAKGEPITLPDGSKVPRIPGYVRWLWDGDFCGLIGFRWQPGTHELPEHVLGHIGYSIVPWKQRRGYATTALGLMLREAAASGLDYVVLTTDPDNVASQKVIEANGGVFVERFVKSPQHGGKPGLRYRIDLRARRMRSTPSPGGASNSS